MVCREKYLEVLGEDAFTAVPADYETYLLSRVIHDWIDERSIAILTRCQQAMKHQGKVLLVERVILTGSTPQLLVLESDFTPSNPAHQSQCSFGQGSTQHSAWYRDLIER